MGLTIPEIIVIETGTSPPPSVPIRVPAVSFEPIPAFSASAGIPARPFRPSSIAESIAPGKSRLLRLGLADSQRSSSQLFAIHGLHGLLRLLLGGHLDESESLGPSGEFIHDDSDRLDRPERREGVSELGLRSRIRQAPHEKFFIH